MIIDILMPEEIFGPLIPIVKADYQQAYEMMQKIEHPLGLYIFTTDKTEIDASSKIQLPSFLIFQSSELSSLGPDTH